MNYPTKLFLGVSPLADAPISYLGGPIRNVCEEVSRNTRAPNALALPVTLAVATAAAQNNTMVKTPLGTVLSLGDAYIVVASSGSGKTSVISPLIKAFLTNDAELKAEFLSTQVKDYAFNHIVWREQKKVFERSIQSSVRDGTEIDEEDKEDFKAHLLSEPHAPVFRTSVIGDATRAALYKAFRGHNSIALLTSEGNTFLDGPLMDDPSLLNDAHDGNPLQVDRANGSSFTVPSPRLTTLIMVQEKAFDRQFVKRGDIKRDIGWLARQKIVVVQPSFGFRPTSNYELTWDATDVFNERILEIMREERQKGLDKTPLLLEFNQEAKDYWYGYVEYIENKMIMGHQFALMRDSASKAPMYAVKLSAVLHRFYNLQGDISKDTLHQAVTISDWYLEQFWQKFGQPETPPEVIDANVLEAWLDDFSNSHPRLPKVFKSYVRRFGPNSLRNNYRLDRALAILASNYKVNVWIENKKQIVTLLPARFPKSQPFVQFPQN